jgi:hypothetical protein
LFFLLMEEGLSHSLSDAKDWGIFHGIHISHSFFLNHMLFVDDVLIFCDGQRDDAESLTNVLALFSRDTSM